MIVRFIAGLIVSASLAACAGNDATLNTVTPRATVTAGATATGSSSEIVLHRASPDLACDAIGVNYSSVTFRIDPAAAEQVSALTNAGQALVTEWAESLQAGTAAERLIRDAAGQVVVRDGDVLQVGQQLRGYDVCFTDSTLSVLLPRPSG